MGHRQPQPPLCVVSGGAEGSTGVPVPPRVREKVHLGPSCLVRRTGDPVAAKGERGVQGHSLEGARRLQRWGGVGGGLVGSELTE